ncbi:MAG TPA: peptidoglycan-binding protein [Actinomycetales bacterium]|nr:peptidoglycan-binding protein [Actinomycetales bacterium]
MTGVEDMIRTAERSLGTTGRPNRITRWYSARNGAMFATAAWCDQSVTFWANESGNAAAVCFGRDYAYTVWHAQRFSKEGQWHVDIAGIRRGDIVFFDWDGSNRVGAIDHIGLVTGVRNGAIYTIEGNTSDGCRRRVRFASTIVGYGRPAYASRPSGSVRAVLRTVTRRRAGVPTDTAPPGSPILRSGSAGVTVRQLQRCLNVVQRSALEVDGEFGPLTAAVVRAFQRASRLLVDGEYGPKTAAKLAAARRRLG